MHGDDKIARFAWGDLEHKQYNGPYYEPFDGGKELIKKAQACATFFSYGTRRDDLQREIQYVKAPKISPKTDISTTRIAARYGMVHSVLLLNQALKKYALGHSAEAMVRSGC